MPEYLLELYVDGNDPDRAAQDGQRIREAAAAFTLQGTPVHYSHSMFISAEETCFVFLEADSVDAVSEAARLAQVSCNRISVVVSHG